MTIATGAARLSFKPIKIDYNTEGIVAFINMYGSNWDWYNTMICPCTIKTQIEEHKFQKLSCTLCNGTGWAYVFNRAIKAIPYSFQREEATLTYRVPEQGIMANIYASLNVLPTDKVNIRDRVVFKDSVTFRSEPKVFSDSVSKYSFTYKIIDLMRVIDNDGTEYDCSHSFQEERDVDVDSDGNLYWIDGNDRPVDGTAFSIYYSFNPSYIIISANHEIRGFTAGGVKPSDVQAWENLPRVVHMKLEIPDVYLF
jgi:hypothetical protein